MGPKTKNRLIKLLLASIWGGVIAYLTLVYAEESPFWEVANQRANVIRIAPQGWAFFTRDPREPVDQAYTQKEGRWVLDGRFYSGTRSFGDLLKRNRLVQVELAHVLSRVDESEWTACKDSLQGCIERGGFNDVTVRNETNLQNLCGRYMIERQPPVPWAWSGASEEVYMPSQIVALDVVCAE